VFSARYVIQLREATTELSEAAASMRSMPRCYKKNKSRVYLVVRQSPASKAVNTEAEEATALPGDNR
jgi:ribosomal protein S2